VEPQPNRRKHDRVAIAIAVHYHDREKQLTCQSRDLSPGGLFLATAGPPPPGAELALRLQLPDPHGEVQARGRVVHCLPGIGMGVEFSEFVADGDQRLRAYLGEW
jgi:uncharacterized protein (TIGR02266 family)